MTVPQPKPQPVHRPVEPQPPHPEVQPQPPEPEVQPRPPEPEVPVPPVEPPPQKTTGAPRSHATRPRLPPGAGAPRPAAAAWNQVQVPVLVSQTPLAQSSSDVQSVPVVASQTPDVLQSEVQQSESCEHESPSAEQVPLSAPQ